MCHVYVKIEELTLSFINVARVSMYTEDMTRVSVSVSTEDDDKTVDR